MNIYEVRFPLRGEERLYETKASNVHTAVKNALTLSGVRTKRGRLKPLSIRKGESVTIRVSRIG